jgi:very-short-patch-repair endonuclease
MTRPPSPGPSPAGGEGNERGSRTVAGPPRPPSPNPLPHEGGGGFAGDGRWAVPPALRKRMKEAARELRRHATRSETLLWSALRRQQLHGRRFRRQQPIGPFVVDFYCATEQLVVEVDGPIHDSREARDAERQRVLESLGLRFLRLPASLVEADLPQALSRIGAAFRSPSPLVGEGPGEGGRRGSAPPPPPRQELRP